MAWKSEHLFHQEACGSAGLCLNLQSAGVLANPGSPHAYVGGFGRLGVERWLGPLSCTLQEASWVLLTRQQQSLGERTASIGLWGLVSQGWHKSVGQNLSPCPRSRDRKQSSTLVGRSCRVLLQWGWVGCGREIKTAAIVAVSLPRHVKTTYIWYIQLWFHEYSSFRPD